GEQLVDVEAPDVSYQLVERAPAVAMQRHREDDRGAGRCHPRQLAEDASVVVDVLDDVEGAHQVEAAIRKGQGADVGERGQPAAGLEAGEGGHADIDEVRAG